MVPLNIALLRGLTSLGGFSLFLCLELVRPYRQPSVSKTKRLWTNVSLTILNSALIGLTFAGATIKAAQSVSENSLGLLNMIGLPVWARIILAVFFLDFAQYFWHLLNHEVPFFWRFHRVHHSDLNMDVSTAMRFHIGEPAMSGCIKICLIYLIGANLISLTIFEILLVLTVQFEHSSLNVPKSFEEILWISFVPPSMHRIHHSVKIHERDTNYGSILSVWDRLLGTLLKDIPQETIVIGVGQYREPEKLGLSHLLLMPFTRSIK